MQVVILAGGLGTRLSEETDLIPKPMVKIGPDPILVHLMRYFASFGHSEFVIAAGYKHEVITSYFEDFNESWNIRIINTGLEASTGGRILLLKDHLEEDFMLTYGDGLGDIDLFKLEAAFMSRKYTAIVTAVRPPARFGSLRVDDDLVTSFNEKDPQDEGWINGGFFVCNKSVLRYISDLKEPFEGKPITHLVEDKMLGVHQHNGWWHPMDTLRDKRKLEAIWESENVPWVKRT
jgi:glucose-1-phosphate cytidylyltransferase